MFIKFGGKCFINFAVSYLDSYSLCSYRNFHISSAYHTMAESVTTTNKFFFRQVLTVKFEMWSRISEKFLNLHQHSVTPYNIQLHNHLNNSNNQHFLADGPSQLHIFLPARRHRNKRSCFD